MEKIWNYDLSINYSLGNFLLLLYVLAQSEHNVCEPWIMLVAEVSRQGSNSVRLIFLVTSAVHYCRKYTKA